MAAWTTAIGSNSELHARGGEVEPVGAHLERSHAFSARRRHARERRGVEHVRRHDRLAETARRSLARDGEATAAHEHARAARHRPATRRTLSTRIAARYSKRADAAAKSTPLLATASSNVPGSDCAGARQVICVALSKTTADDNAVPNRQRSAPLSTKPAPRTTTGVPPFTEPLAGSSDSTDASAWYVNVVGAVTNCCPFVLRRTLTVAGWCAGATQTTTAALIRRRRHA